MIVPDYLANAMKKLKEEYQIEELVPSWADAKFQEYLAIEAKIKAKINPIYEEFKNPNMADKRYLAYSFKNNAGTCYFVGCKDPERSEANRYIGVIEYKENNATIWKCYGEYYLQIGSNPVFDGIIYTHYYGPSGLLEQTILSHFKDGIYMTEELNIKSTPDGSLKALGYLKQDSTPQKGVPMIVDVKNGESYQIIINLDDKVAKQININKRSKNNPIGLIQMYHTSIHPSESALLGNMEEAFIDEQLTYGTKTNGKGKFISPNENTEYEGELALNFRYQGYGKLKAKLHKTECEGEFADGQLILGKITSDDCTYEGELKHGMQHGKGRVTYENGDKYEGEYVMGRMEGTGTYSYVNGDQYKGQMLQNMFNGHGVMSLHNGCVFDGEFDMNQYKKGKLYIPFSAYSCTEHAVNSMTTFGYAAVLQSMALCISVRWKQIVNTILNRSKWVEVFEGDFNSDNTYHGKGIHTDCFGNVYEGDFRMGSRSGTGTLKNYKGDVYFGEFSADMFDGKGNLKLVDGTEYTGEFKAGEYEGYGVLVKPDGSIQEGMWKAGKLEKPFTSDNDNGAKSGSASDSGNNSNKMNMKPFIWPNDNLNPQTSIMAISRSSQRNSYLPRKKMTLKTNAPNPQQTLVQFRKVASRIAKKFIL